MYSTDFLLLNQNNPEDKIVDWELKHKNIWVQCNFNCKLILCKLWANFIVGIVLNQEKPLIIWPLFFYDNDLTCQQYLVN